MKWLRQLKSPTSDLFGQLIRYAVSGGIAFLVDASLLYCVTTIGGLHYLIGAACGSLAGIVCTYLLSVTWIFDQRRIANRKVEFLVFALIAIVGIGLTQLFMWLFTDVLFQNREYYLYSKLITTVIVSLVNFILKKCLLFTAGSAKD